MITNYFKIAWRNLWRNKLYAGITISGLSLAMAGAILLLVWIANAVSVDQFHYKKDQLYKVFKNETNHGFIETSDVLPAALANDLQNNYPEIKAVTRVVATSKVIVSSDKKFKTSGNIVDGSFLTMFSFPLEKGNIASPFSNSQSVLLTASLAAKIFPGTEAIGQPVFLDGELFIVGGILKDLPNNTQFKFDFLIPWKQQAAASDNAWTSSTVAIYALLDPSADATAFNKKIQNDISKYSNNELHAQPFLYPFNKTWLYGDFSNGEPVGSGIIIVRLLFGVVFILLLIGAINFMNLSTARGAQRAKEIGVRKIAGANKKALISQFMGESILMATIACIIALMIAQLLLPSFNHLTEKQLAIQYQSPWFWLSAVIFILFTGSLAGSYPAFYLSSVKAISGLKKSVGERYALLTPRKILVVIQFVVSIIMINYAYTIIQQTKYVMARNTGFLKNQLLFHPMSADLKKNYDVVKAQLLQSGKVAAVNQTNLPITSRGAATNQLKWQGETLGYSFELLTCDMNFASTNGLQLLKGRDIDIAAFPSDTASCLVNETAMTALGGKNLIGQTIVENGNVCTITGVIKDFVNDFPGQPVRPLMVRGSSHTGFINIRLNTSVTLNEVNGISDILKKYNGDNLTEIQLASADYARQFKGAEVSISLVVAFSLVAIFISCLGLFGLSIFMVSTRTKEIGVRKVLGAGVATIGYLLTRDFIKLVTIAVVIGSPIAWIATRSAVQNFAYRISVDWWVLIVTGVSCILIAGITVGITSMKAALLNPVDSLKVE